MILLIVIKEGEKESSIKKKEPACHEIRPAQRRGRLHSPSSRDQT